MSSVIKIKRSDVAESVPSTLEHGEIAVNIADRKLFVGKSDNSVEAIGGDRLSLTSSSVAEGAYLRMDSDNAALANNVLLRGDSGITISQDANGSISFAGDGSGSAASWTTARTVTFSGGDVTGSFSIDGSADVSAVNLTIAPDSVALGTDTTGDFVQSVTAGSADVSVTGTGEGAAVSVDLAATISSDTTGSAASWTTGRTVTFSGGDVTGSFSIDGSADVSAVGLTIAPNSVALGTDTTGNYMSGISGTANEIEVTHTPGEASAAVVGLPNDVTIGNDLTITNNLQVSGDTTITGDLTVNGTTTTISTTTVEADDSMFKMAASNAADSVDSGIYAMYVDGISKYSGYFRDATDGIFKFYTGLEVEPTTTVNAAGAGYALAQVDAIIDGGSY